MENKTVSDRLREILTEYWQSLQHLDQARTGFDRANLALKSSGVNLADYRSVSPWIAEMDQERWRRWVSAAHAVARIDKWLLVPVQGIGRLDAKLVLTESRIIDDRNWSNETETFEFNDAFTLSWLWVLGCYEIVRTAYQRCRSDQGLVDAVVKEEINRVKRLFERIRMPLAKLEPANRHRATDWRVAFPGVDRKHGIAWRLGELTWINRRELSDAMLGLLESMKTGNEPG